MRKPNQRKNLPRNEDPIVEKISISPPPDKERRYASKMNCVLFKQSIKGQSLYPESLMKTPREADQQADETAKNNRSISPEKKTDELLQQRSQSPKTLKSIEYQLQEPLYKGMSNLTLTENMQANKSLANLEAKERIQ